MRSLALTILFSVLVLAHPALAEEPPIGMITPGGPHHECGRGWATPITFRELMSNIESWVGRCVRVRGITRSRLLYGDLPDFYRAMNADPAIVQARGPKMGMYAKDDAMEKRLFRYRQEVEVVAMAYTCKRFGEWIDLDNKREDSDERRLKGLHPGDDSETFRLGYPTGYCHYTNDPVLFVSEVQVVNKGPVRLEGAAALLEHGDIDPLPPTDPEYFEAWSRLTAWFDALRRRDGEALLKLTADVKAEDLSEKDGWLYQLLNNRDSGARFLFRRRALPLMKMFRARNAPEALLMGCLCKSDHCEDRWPIHSADAILADAWPYACMWIHKTDGKYAVGG